MSKAVTYRIIHPDGLYAGLVEKLIKFAGDFNSDISISYGGRTVNFKSFMGVVSLGIPNKADITITAISAAVAVIYEEMELNANRLTMNASVPVSFTRGSSLCRIDVPG